MKKQILFTFMLIAFLTCAYAVSGDFGFGIVWRYTNDKSTTLSVLAPDGSDLEIGESGNKERTLNVSEEEQDAFKLRIHTNEARRHSLQFQFTPFISDTSRKFGYTIRYYLSDANLGIQSEGVYNIGNTAALYPEGNESFGAEFNLNNLAGYVDVDIEFYITLTEAGNMDGFSSATVTILEEAE